MIYMLGLVPDLGGRRNVISLPAPLLCLVSLPGVCFLSASQITPFCKVVYLMSGGY